MEQALIDDARRAATQMYNKAARQWKVKKGKVILVGTSKLWYQRYEAWSKVGW